MSELRYLTLDELLKANIRIPEELLGTWLKTHQIAMAYAPSGVGKSMFAMSVALAVAGGGEYLGWKAASCNKVLIVDGEMDMYELQERSNLLINSIGSLNIEAAKKNLSFLPFQGQTDDVNWPDLANPEDHDVILKRIKKEKPKLVIFDNLSTLANVEDENSASAWRPCLELLKKIKRLGCTSIIIHHSRKGNVLTSNAYRGSQILSVLLDSIILLEEPEGGPSIGGATFRVNFQKVRGKRSSDTEPRSAILNEDGQWEWDVLAIGKAYEVAAAIRTRDYVNQTKVAEGLGWSKGEVSKQLRKAYEAGIITSDEVHQCFEDAKSLEDDLDDDDDF